MTVRNVYVFVLNYSYHSRGGGGCGVRFIMER